MIRRCTVSRHLGQCFQALEFSGMAENVLRFIAPGTGAIFEILLPIV